MTCVVVHNLRPLHVHYSAVRLILETHCKTSPDGLPVSRNYPSLHVLFSRVMPSNVPRLDPGCMTASQQLEGHSSVTRRTSTDMDKRSKSFPLIPRNSRLAFQQEMPGWTRKETLEQSYMILVRRTACSCVIEECSCVMRYLHHDWHILSSPEAPSCSPTSPS